MTSVVYRLRHTGKTPHEVVEDLLTDRCPTCGADWRRRGAVTPRHEGGRAYRCEVCTTHHRARELDEDGHPVQTPGWGLARQQRAAQAAAAEHDETAPAATPIEG